MPWGYRVTAGDMKQTLPWSVTGIPPEAREAARAAASREGLTVGDWLTKQILGEAALGSQQASQQAPTPEAKSDWPAPSGPRRFARDEETRREGAELTSHIARAEAETDSAFRRIDETLRGMTRRLEAAERSQNEASRAMGAAAADINAAAREQANAFGTLAERIERVERHSDTSSLRDAVRGLHQGLSRLADQIARTANESSTQVSSLAANVEALAGKLTSTRDESTKSTQALEMRMAQLAERVHAAEESSENAMKALRTALGLFESRLASAEPKAEEAARHASAIQNLERTVDEIAQRVTGAETRASGSEEKMHDELGRHLSAIERSLDTIVQRLETGEKEHRETLADLRSNLGETAKRIDAMAKPVAAAAARPEPVFAPAMAAPELPMAAPVLDLPPFSELPHAHAAAFAPPPMQDTAPPPPPAEETPPMAPPPFEPAAVFAAEPPRPQAVPVDYLAAARRAAAAAVEAEPQAPPRGSLGGFRMADSENRSGLARTALIGAIVLLVVVAALAGILFTNGVGRGPSEAINQRTDQVGQIFTQQNRQQAGEPAQPAPATSGDQGYGSGAPLPARPLSRDEGPQDMTPSPSWPDEAVSEPDTSMAPAPEPAPANTASDLPARPAHTLTPQNNAATAPPQKMAALPPSQPAPTSSPLDTLRAKAGAGSVNAELVLGLKYLEGDGVAASDTEAMRWITKAAQQGQPVAQYRLGTMYERGRGTTADTKKAHDWYAKSAQQGNRKAMHNLAVSYAQGAGAEKNFSEAARWFTQASQLGLVDSQFNLAVLYERGLGVPPSLRDAYRWYAIAGANGDTESKSRLEALGTQITPEDRATAQKAAADFHPQPMNRAANEAPSIAQAMQ